ncbi:hypothetical protein F441_20029 [Phytophthora nicotianae CJ01A1]|uniref:Uncharacterized protein n=1 Tax=Phytophthora nicotianae CJ01A1 TaxID=1317063 RepID=W2VZ08_PHYNI|nr:hypothetical protein F441_20029 [Phytophthora nicotianae CJ01A1]
MTTPMVADNPWSETCGMKVLASYVRVGGDLERLDKSCVAEMPAFNLTTPDYYLYSYFGTDVADDGVFNSTLPPMLCYLSWAFATLLTIKRKQCSYLTLAIAQETLIWG